MTKFQVVCDDDQLEKWQSYAEDDPESQNFSDFVRTAIVREIHTDEEDGQTSGGESIEADLGGIPDDITKIHNELTDIHDRLDRIDSMAGIKQGDPDNLVRRIEKNIPTLPKQAISGWISQQMDGKDLSNEYPEGGKAIASTTRLANYLDEDEYETRQAAYELEHDDDIITERENGETFIFRIKQ